ncbi:MAG: hypothetical protein L0Z62_07050 [Gemmataceae bacterium]|nr:hypothetical protein [Gemmataceae bacterium]
MTRDDDGAAAAEGQGRDEGRPDWLEDAKRCLQQNGPPNWSEEKRSAWLEEAIRCLREALREGRRDDATKLYRGHQNDTEAMTAALLSVWQTFVDHPGSFEELSESATDVDIAGFFMRLACRRMRRKRHADQRVAAQVAWASVRGMEGDILPFDPEDPKGNDEFVKNTRREIAEVLGKRSPHERFVIEMRMAGYTGREIVERVKEEFPDAPNSAATVSRIWDRFRDELWARLKSD